MFAKLTWNQYFTQTCIDLGDGLCKSALISNSIRTQSQQHLLCSAILSSQNAYKRPIPNDTCLGKINMMVNW